MVATAVASQVMLVSIAMQLNRIEQMVDGLSQEMHRDRIAEVHDFMDKVAACDIRSAAQKARLVEFTDSQPPQAIWEAFLKAEPEIRDQLKVMSGSRTGNAAVAIEFTLSDFQGATDGTLP